MLSKKKQQNQLLNNENLTVVNSLSDYITYGKTVKTRTFFSRDFWKVYLDFWKSSIVFILFSLFNGILPVVICLFVSMVKPFGTQYTMAIGYITAIQLGFLQLGWTIILTFVYSFNVYKSKYWSCDTQKDEFVTFSLIISLIYATISAPLFIGSSYLYNMYASNHLNTLLGQQQAYYYIYISWIFIFISAFSSTFIINFQIFKNWKYASGFQLLYMILCVAFCFIFTNLIGFSNPNTTTSYKLVYPGYFVAVGLIVGASLSLLITWICFQTIVGFRFTKIQNLKFKVLFHLKNTWKTLLVILTIQIMKAVCLIGIGLGLQDSVDGLVPLSYQMTRVVWYNILYLLPFLGYGLADAIYFYGFTHKLKNEYISKIVLYSSAILIIFYIPYAAGIYYSITPLIDFYITNINTDLMISNNLINLNAINIEYLLNTMLKKPEYLEIVQKLGNQTYLSDLLYKVLRPLFPSSSYPQINNFINQKIINLCNEISTKVAPYFQEIANPATRVEALNRFVKLVNNNPQLTFVIKELFFNIVQNTSVDKTGSLILYPQSNAYWFLACWCIWYPMGLMYLKSSIVLRQEDIDTKEMILNLVAQAAVIASIVSFGVELQYSQPLWMYNAWSFPLFIVSWLAILYYMLTYIFTYIKVCKPRSLKKKNQEIMLANEIKEWEINKEVEVIND